MTTPSDHVPPADAVDPAPAARRPGPLAADGRFVTRGGLAARALYWVGWLLVTPEGTVSTTVRREIDVVGVGAVRVVIGSSLLVGLIVTLQIAAQLAPFGAESVTGRALAWFVARELGPVSVAILVIARSAASSAGELAAMTVNAEVDALRAMGLDPIKHLVAPRLAGLLVALPALTIIANGLIVLGGWIGNVLFLGLTTGLYLDAFRAGFELRDIVAGLAKAVLFALVIGLVSADAGLSASRRPGGIGAAATQAVALSLIGVLAADTLVNVVVYFIPDLV